MPHISKLLVCSVVYASLHSWPRTNCSQNCATSQTPQSRNYFHSLLQFIYGHINAASNTLIARTVFLNVGVYQFYTYTQSVVSGYTGHHVHTHTYRYMLPECVTINLTNIVCWRYHATVMLFFLWHMLYIYSVQSYTCSIHFFAHIAFIRVWYREFCFCYNMCIIHIVHVHEIYS